MYPFILSLFIVPVIVSGLLLILPKSISRILIIVTSFILSGIALYLFITINDPYHFAVPHYINKAVAFADIILLLYFGWVAIRRKSWLVGLLTILQVIAFAYLNSALSGEGGKQFMVDKLSVFMFLLINVISSIIAIYSLRYIEEEE